MTHRRLMLGVLALCLLADVGLEAQRRLLGFRIRRPQTGATKYVDNASGHNCTDAPGNGSQAAPYCTIPYGIGQIAGGDTLYVKAGTYADGFTITGPSGTANAHTLIRGFPGDLPIIEGSGFSSGRVKISHSCTYIDFAYFEITNFNQGLYLDDDAGTDVACTNLVVEHLKVHDVGQEGIAIRAGAPTGARHFTVRYNEVYNTGRLGTQNGEGVYVGSSSGTDNTNGVILLGNTVHDTQDECVELKGDSHDVVVDGNNIYACLSPGSSFSDTGGGIEIDEPRNSVVNPNHVIRNNTVHDIVTTGGITKRGIRAGTGATVYNNVLYGIGSGYSCILSNTANYTRVIYHNTVDCTTANAIVNSGTTMDSKNNIGPNTTSNLAFSSAYFVNAAGHDYRLVTGAAAAAAGLDLRATVPLDILGVLRPATPNLGAYEGVF